MLNSVILMGRLTADPELRQTQNGTSVTSFTVAVDRRFQRDQTDFINVVAWKADRRVRREIFQKRFAYRTSRQYSAAQL